MAEKTSYLSYEGLQTLVAKIRAKFAPISVVNDLAKTDASLKLTDGSLDAHIKDAVKHITTEERTKWNAAADTAAGSVSKNEYYAKVADIDSSIAGINTTLAGKADKATTLAGYGIEDAYTKNEVEAKISALGSVFSFKGTIENVAALPKADNKTGDVWHVTEKSAEYVWDGSKWEELGSTVDLSSYATKTDVDAKFTDPNGSFAGTAAKATKAEDSKKLGGVAADKYAQLTDITLKGVNVNGTALAIDASKNVNVTVVEGTANGTIAVNGVDVSVKGLGSAAYTDSTAYATKAELKTLNDASTSYEKSANKVDDISTVVEGEVSVKYPSVKAVKKAIKEGIDAGDTKVKQTAITDGVHPILMAGTESSGTSAEAKYAAGVTIDASNGILTATTFAGALDGNAKTATEATKATQDADGNVITATYATKSALEAQMVTAISTKEVEDLFA